MITLPAPFVAAIVAMRGAEGAAWLDRLPAVVDRLAGEWAFVPGEPFANLSYNVVLSVTRMDGSPAVLKLGWAVDREFASEQAALAHFAGRGAGRLLAATTVDGVPAMLLARVTPGIPLTALWQDETATAAAAGVMRALWQAPPPDPAAPFPTVAAWGAGFDRLAAHLASGGGGIAPDLAARAGRLFAGLVASQAPQVLLHGDLHHDNILANTNDNTNDDPGRAPWLAIDPKGVIGEPAYEIGAFLRNPGALFSTHLAEAPAISARRIADFASLLDLDPGRIRAWAFAQAVLSAWWCIEDNAPCLPIALAQAGVFAALLQPGDGA